MHNDDDTDQLANALMKILQALPPEKQEDAFQEMMSAMLKKMSIWTLREMRQEIVDRFQGHDLFVVRSTLLMIDGQMALRKIAAGEEWR